MSVFNNCHPNKENVGASDEVSPFGNGKWPQFSSVLSAQTFKAVCPAVVNKLGAGNYKEMYYSFSGIMHINFYYLLSECLI